MDNHYADLQITDETFLYKLRYTLLICHPVCIRDLRYPEHPTTQSEDSRVLYVQQPVLPKYAVSIYKAAYQTRPA